MTAQFTVEEVGTERVGPAGAVEAAPAAAAVSPTAVTARDLRFALGGERFAARLHPAESGDAAVLWVFGSGGGLGGPSGGIYARLGASLVSRGVSSLELDYRRPGQIEACVEDALAGIAYLEGLCRRRIVLVGHSFGAAVVIEAALGAPSVVAVCAMSGEAAGAGRVGELAPRSTLFIHGEADEVTPPSGSLDLFKRARDPKQLLLYPDCGHGLDQCGTSLDRDLAAWIGAELELSV